jgi:hypothetical protein
MIFENSIEIIKQTEFDYGPKPKKHKKYNQLKDSYIKLHLSEKINSRSKNSDGIEFKESQRSLSRKIRSPIKIGLLSSQKEKKDDQMTVSEESEDDSESPKLLNIGKIDNKKSNSKQVKVVKEGSSDTINQNSGSAFIINDNYYAYVGGKLTKLKEAPKGLNKEFIFCLIILQIYDNQNFYHLN